MADFCCGPSISNKDKLQDQNVVGYVELPINAIADAHKRILYLETGNQAHEERMYLVSKS
jgi:hypothetical protein